MKYSGYDKHALLEKAILLIEKKTKKERNEVVKLVFTSETFDTVMNNKIDPVKTSPEDIVIFLGQNQRRKTRTAFVYAAQKRQSY